jgi:uncharacterized membrane protein YebE (DUF533 family)
MAVGGLALKAWQVHSVNKEAQSAPVAATPAQPQTVAATPVAAPQLVTDAPVREENPEEAALIIKFMIAAAHADGILTHEEQSKIWHQAVESQLPADELAILSAALSQPTDVQQLATLPRNMEEKIEAYTAAAVVIEKDCPDGHNFLEQLGAALQLQGG